MSRTLQAIYWQAGWIEGRQELIKTKQKELETLRSDTPIISYMVRQSPRGLEVSKWYQV